MNKFIRIFPLLNLLIIVFVIWYFGLSNPVGATIVIALGILSLLAAVYRTPLDNKDTTASKQKIMVVLILTVLVFVGMTIYL